MEICKQPVRRFMNQRSASNCFLILLHPNIETSTGQWQISTSTKHWTLHWSFTDFCFNWTFISSTGFCGARISTLPQPPRSKFTKNLYWFFLVPPYSLQKLIGMVQALLGCEPTHPALQGCPLNWFHMILSYFVGCKPSPCTLLLVLFLLVKGIVKGFVYTYINP